MHFNRLSLKEFIKKYSIKIPPKSTIENFKTQISNFLNKALKQTQEEYQKNEISNF
ncbi:hypothetical protein IY889_08360, partial [Campylobacter volucris]|nr:hypothetical protein [Campylobacter volucris]